MSFILFNFLYLISDFIVTYSKYPVEFDVFYRFYWYQFIDLSYKIFPISCFMATFMTFSQVYRENELLALLSFGQSFFRVYRSVLIFTFVASLVSFWAADRFLPSVVKNKKYIYYVEMKKKPYLYTTIKADKIWYRSNNKIFHIKTLDSEKKTAQGLSLYYFDSSWGLKSLVQAKKVKINEGAWQLFEGTEVTFGGTTDLNYFPEPEKFNTKTIDMGEGVSDINSLVTSFDVMSLRQLKSFIVQNKKVGLDILNYETDYYFKISAGLHGFFLSLLILPFAVYRSHRESFGSKGLFLGLATVSVYWVVYYWSFNLGKQGVILPVMGAWIASIGAVIFSTWRLYRLKI